MIKSKAKNSTSKRTKTAEIFKKTKIRLKIECTGFLEIITNSEKVIQIKDKK